MHQCLESSPKQHIGLSENEDDFKNCAGDGMGVDALISRR